MNYLSLTITIPSEGIDPESVGELLIEAGAGSVEYLEPSGKLRVYLEEDAQSTIRERIDCFNGTVIECDTITPQNWVTLCPDLQHPLAVGGLTITPHASAEGVKPTPGIIHIIPGMGFGTGHHDTTHALIGMLGQLADRGALPRSIVDVGTGSGILAIAATMLFPNSSVVATDIDEAALENARENAALNGVSSHINLLATSIPTLPSPADLVVANLYAELLIELRDELIAITRPGGSLLLSGIMVERDPAIERAFGEGLLSLEARWESPVAPHEDEPGRRWGCSLVYEEIGMKALSFEKHGGPEVLSFREVPSPTPKGGWTLIAVRAVALNHLDIWVRRGWPGLRLPLPHWTGSDVVGTVAAHDPAQSSDAQFACGTRVAVNPGYLLGNDEWTERGEHSVSPLYRILGEDCRGGLAEYALVPTECLIPLPDNLSDPLAAAFLLTGTTVWRMLFTRGQLAVGKTVLVVGAGGGVNSLAVFTAKRHGATVIALAGTEEKRRAILALGADEAICYRDIPEWHREVLRLTDGRGVDLVVDNTGAATFEKSLKALRRGGRLVTVGNTSGPHLSLDNRLIFSKQLSILGSTMGSHDDFRRATEFLWRIARDTPSALDPLIDTVAPFEQAIELFARLEAGEQFGKIVLTLPAR